MAVNRTAQEAMDYAKRFVGDMPVDDSEVKLRILNDASDMVHEAANWRWTVAFLSSQALTFGTIDYDFTDPTDLLYLVKGRLVNGNVSPAIEEDLTVTHNLSNDTSIDGQPTQIAIVDADTYRIQPVPQGTSGEEPTILTWYKLQNTDITTGNVSTASTLLFPDEWFWVYQQVVLLFAMTFTNDFRTGTVTVNGNTVSYSGQWGVVQGALEVMKEKEKPFLRGVGEIIL